MALSLASVLHYEKRVKRTTHRLLLASWLTVLIPTAGLAQSVPSLDRMFDNEKTYTATPSVTFSSTVGVGGELLQYEIQWDTVRGFIAADPLIENRRSWEDSGFTNLDDGADLDPFESGETIEFTFPSGVLTDGTTYWWRVRSRRSDTLALSAWLTPRTFTVDTAQTVYPQWHQTTSQQFVNDTLTDAVTGLETPTLSVIDSGVTHANGAMHIEAVDLDGDGDTDVVTAAGASNQFAWYENDGTMSFARHIIDNTANADGAYDIDAVDFDGDGDIDVVTAASISDQFAWYENDGAMSFALHVIDDTNNANEAREIEPVDLDGDGDTDVVTAAFLSESIRLVRERRRNEFRPARHRRHGHRQRSPGDQASGPRRRRRHRRGDRG